MRLYNTRTRQVMTFKPLHPPRVTLYSCGPTVYDYTHIGHVRSYCNVDWLRRALQYLGLQVKQVMNITDVGHLTGDSDEGDDKLEKGAQKHKKTVWEVAQFFTDYFFSTIESVNILAPDIACRATDHVTDMIALITRLEKKGFTYETPEAIYFDTAKFPTYGRLTGQDLADKKVGVREKVVVDPQKKHPADFALWFKRVGRFENHIMHWSSPWGSGFPGWHIECSAMSIKYLGETIDLHTGGIDHIPVHHTNEIAQSEAATGHEFVKYWFHSEFVRVDGHKMSKSLGNIYTLAEVVAHNINPLALRYLFGQTHYRQEVNFSWEALQQAQHALLKLHRSIERLKRNGDHTDNSQSKIQAPALRKKFHDAISDDLNMPQATAILWETLRSDLTSEIKLKLLLEFDIVFGFNLDRLSEPDTIPKAVKVFARQRQQAREQKDFARGDQLRLLIEAEGFQIEDIGHEYRIIKRR